MQFVRVYLAPAVIAAGLVFVHGAAVAASAENGKSAFVKYACWQCHGFEGQGSITTSGGRVIADTKLTVDTFAAYVRKPTGGMPPFSAAMLPDADLADIYAYLQARPKPQAGKDIPLLNP
jgi:mono/diheme cytochrome c family protein